MKLTWADVLGIFIEQGDDAIRWRSEVRLRWPIVFRRHYTKWPKLHTPPRTETKESAATPSAWKPGEQSDNLATRKQ